jgi:hypothetical protein
MDPQAARFLVIGVASIGAVVWLAAWRFHLRTFAEKHSSNESPGSLSEETPENWIVGSAELPGQPEPLAAKAASLLASGGAQQLPPLRILERTSERVAFEAAEVPQTGRGATGYVEHGELRFTPVDAEKTAVDYAVVVGSPRGLRVGGAIFLAAGLVALVGGTWAMLTFVASNANPEVRWQSFQMIQVIHVLWPPFLFAGLHRARFRGIRTVMETLVHNLPYLEAKS